MDLLKGKTAIVTGASSGIGYATARLFAAHGANLVVNARGKQALEQLVDEIICKNGHAIGVAGDVGDETLAKTLVASAINTYGSLDIAFNNAGCLGEMGDITNLTSAGWQETMRTNLTSGFYAAKYQIPALLDAGSGSLLFTSSFVGHTVGMPGMAAYGAAKAGLIGLTKSLAAEYSPQGLRVNALLPGGTDTPMARSFATTTESVQFVESIHALKRMADPQEIAQAALFLASDMARFVTGTALLVDGGVSITRT